MSCPVSNVSVGGRPSVEHGAERGGAGRGGYLRANEWPALVFPLCFAHNGTTVRPAGERWSPLEHGMAPNQTLLQSLVLTKRDVFLASVDSHCPCAVCLPCRCEP